MDTTIHMNRDLTVAHGTSRGRDTYGYGIVTLHDYISGKKFKTIGGGYDMHGTVLGEWFEDCLKTNTFLRQAFAKGVKKALKEYPNERLYGMNMKTRKGKDGWIKARLIKEILNQEFHLDGGCGSRCIEEFITMAGLKLKSNYIRATRKGAYDQFTGWTVSVDPKGVYARVCKKAGQNLYLD